MKRLLRVLSSRAASPLVAGFFLLLYIGIAFFTDETLIALMEFTRRSVVLVLVLALLPLNSAGRIVAETLEYLKRRRALAGDAADVPPGLFDDSVTLPVSPAGADGRPAPGPPSLAQLQGRLDALGYKTLCKENVLAAWRGFSGFPARLLYLVGVFCLFSGILISLTSRVSYRGTVVEREPLPAPSGDGGIVEKITYAKSDGLILARDLTIETAALASGGRKQVFGVYPPSRYEGSFVYPRYLGIGLFIRFSAPDLRSVYENRAILAIYPPGKEAAVEIPDSPYRILVSLAKPEDGSDPYMTGQFVISFKLLKGKEVISSGSVPGGAEFVHDGYRLSFPDARRAIVTDFIRDYGVMPIWISGMLFGVSFCIWLLYRLFLPRRDMLFIRLPHAVHACSRAEGRGRTHSGTFHEALDFIEEGKTTGGSFMENAP